MPYTKSNRTRGKGEHLKDFAEEAGHYRLHQKRQAALKQISTQHLAQLRREAGNRPGRRRRPARRDGGVV